MAEFLAVSRDFLSFVLHTCTRRAYDRPLSRPYPPLPQPFPPRTQSHPAAVPTQPTIIFQHSGPVDVNVLSTGTLGTRLEGAMLSLPFSRFSLTAAFLFFFAGTRLNAKFVFVDDSETDLIKYSEDGVWKVGNDCTSCLARPDKTWARNETWHECVG